MRSPKNGKNVPLDSPRLPQPRTVNWTGGGRWGGGVGGGGGPFPGVGSEPGIAGRRRLCCRGSGRRHYTRTQIKPRALAV